MLDLKIQTQTTPGTKKILENMNIMRMQVLPAKRQKINCTGRKLLKKY